VNETKRPDLPSECCGILFYAHHVKGRHPLIVLECCTCGRFWHQREDGQLVEYDTTLLPAIRGVEGGDHHVPIKVKPRRANAKVHLAGEELSEGPSQERGQRGCLGI
jgi:hypothetical protein